MADRPGTEAGGAVGRRCPTCGKPTVDRWRPFCSKRCADIDLGRWLGEHYRVPGEDETAPEAEAEPEEP